MLHFEWIYAEFNNAFLHSFRSNFIEKMTKNIWKLLTKECTTLHCTVDRTSMNNNETNLKNSACYLVTSISLLDCDVQFTLCNWLQCLVRELLLALTCLHEFAMNELGNFIGIQCTK